MYGVSTPTTPDTLNAQHITRRTKTAPPAFQGVTSGLCTRRPGSRPKRNADSICQRIGFPVLDNTLRRTAKCYNTHSHPQERAPLILL